MGTVGLVALVLAASGIDATVSNFVVRQRPNVTIRLALGATTGRVIGEVLRNTLVLAAIGLVLGVSAAYPLLKALSGILFGAGGMEISRVAASSLLIAPIAVLSAYIPARAILRFHIADVLKDV
jgi:ABC-type antimicrobial peptide transport system permease subunit